MQPRFRNGQYDASLADIFITKLAADAHVKVMKTVQNLQKIAWGSRTGFVIVLVYERATEVV